MQSGKTIELGMVEYDWMMGLGMLQSLRQTLLFGKLHVQGNAF